MEAAAAMEALMAMTAAATAAATVHDRMMLHAAYRQED